MKETATGAPNLPDGEPVLPRLGARGMLRWAWRQLTSMRNALLLLLLLAVAAVPGSLFPQRPVNPSVVTQYLKDHPDYGPWLDKFQFFNVYASVWFSAIYLLLFISLVGCVVPRARAHWKAMRSAPPRTPKRLSRLPEYGTLELPASAGISAGQAVQDAARLLRRRRYRVHLYDAGGDRPSVAGERGMVREAGNLLFHLSLVGVLVCVALGGLFGYRGQKILVEGDTFVNTLVGYDQFAPGASFDPARLDPFAITLNKFSVTFDRSSKAHYGQPIDFTAAVTVTDKPGAAPVKKILKVNDPITIGGASFYLVGNGYAPVVTIKDGTGKTAFSGPVVSIPSDGAYTSLLVIKAPDARPSQLGFVGFFLPTALVNEQGISYASDPDPLNPRLNLNSYYGDLGLNAGVPRNVYTLDTKNLTPLNNRNLKAGGIVLAPGQRYTLPEGKGSISFDGIKRYVGIDVRHDPGQIGVLVFSLAALAGLIASLFIGRHRAWVRTGTHPDGRTMVEYGLLARGENHRLAVEADALGTLLHRHWLGAGETTTTSPKDL
ncbi:cytochrome c biogenesis protein ResB [Arthrobacter sp. A2-55]|uniref:cytochrome c biogenesis protein ResB n=1 Tax=Arthrobacter sp. A2-55 TaxID=2897337 RepID=UPI003977C0F1